MLGFVAAVLESNPRLPRGVSRYEMDEAEIAERKAWRRLTDDADDDFDTAENALASRIQNLWPFLAPEGRYPDSEGDLFVPPPCVMPVRSTC